MHRWKLSALAAAAICLAGLHAPDASALTLGRVSVQSALGEPLRADIDLPQITPAEAESLRASLATPDVFRAQGLEYSPTLNGVNVALERRSDGSMALRLSSDRPINDPFVDLVIDASWNAGRVVRSYTMLFDPPSLRRPAPAVTAAAQVTAPPAASPAAAARPAPQPQPRAATATATAPAPAPAARPQPSAAPAAPRPAASPAPDEVVVRPGDTAGRIASANRPAGVSLDQMLVAMMRANPEAFIRGNVNRVRAGAVLQLPDEAQAQATPPAEARQIIAAQSRDFNEFRRRLATAAPKAEVAAADRSASGSVQTQVEDRKAATAAPDKLTLSKGGVQASRAEEQLAKDKQAHEASARMAELSKNISDLNKLSAASPAAGAASAAAAAPAASASAPNDEAKTGLSTTAPQPAASAAAAAASAAADSASAPASAASAAQAAASAPASSPAAAVPPADAAEQPSFLSTMMEEPLAPGAALAIILALLGYGGWRAAKRRRAQAADSAFLESRVPPDSFFGASGGERVDTSNGGGANSSLAYSPSQLDAGGDVDPVAEADVYLAYGRDLQAEEILKEAARHHPERVAIPAKLADIYAKRQDRKAFESAARDVLRLTNGQGPDWSRVAEQGRSIDPDNSLYQEAAPAAAEASASPAPDAVAPGAFASALAGAAVAAGLAQAEAPAPAAPAPAPADTSDDDLDIDLDLSGDALSEAPPAAEAPAAPPPASSFAQAAAAAAGATAEPETPPAPPSLPDLDLSGFEMPADPQGRAPASAAADDERIDPPDFSASDLTMLDDVPGTAPDAAAAPQEAREFDLGDLSLDLDLPNANASAEAAPASEAAAPAADGETAADDPLATKLALAEEFNAIGDSEGARTLIEEVIAESSGELKARAQRLLADIG